MTDAPVNLNKARKLRARLKAKARADENAARHGRTQAEVLSDTARTDRVRSFLDARRLTEDD